MLGYHRACVGKNLAKMELQISIATVFHHYGRVLEDPGRPVRSLTLAGRGPG